MLFETCYYIVEIIDGDHAHLKKVDDESGELKLVARALHPEAIVVGSQLKYEMLQYELV
jgi:predicted transcriptional regulator